MERSTSKEMCKKHAVVFNKECPVCKEENLYGARYSLREAFQAGFKGDKAYYCRTKSESSAFVHGVAFRCEFVLVHINEA